MTKKNKTYNVSFDMKYSYNYTVKAKTPAEAKKKAFAKFKATRNRISQFNAWVDEEL